MKKFRNIVLLSLAAVALGGCTAGQIPGYNGNPNAIVSPNEAVWNGTNLLQSVNQFGETFGQLGEGW